MLEHRPDERSVDRHTLLYVTFDTFMIHVYVWNEFDSLFVSFSVSLAAAAA